MVVLLESDIGDTLQISRVSLGRERRHGNGDQAESVCKLEKLEEMQCCAEHEDARKFEEEDKTLVRPIMLYGDLGNNKRTSKDGDK